MDTFSRKRLLSISEVETIGPKVVLPSKGKTNDVNDEIEPNRAEKRPKIESKRSGSASKGTREVLHDDIEPVKVKKRQKMLGSNQWGVGNNNSDRISLLPEPIIHHILSLLSFPEDVARTSILSKSWRSMWSSFHYFNFDEKKFRSQGPEEFRNYVQTSLSTRLSQLVSVDKFRINITSYDERLSPCLDRWLSDVIAKKIKDLELCVNLHKKRCWYSLPNFVLIAESLTSLKISGCKFMFEIKVKLPNLQILSIKEATVNARMLQTFMEGCPSIEDLRLIHCRGLTNLYISGLSKLERVEVYECKDVDVVEIRVPTLQTFWYCGKRKMSCIFHFEGCENLKSLTLMCATITGDTLHELLSAFPVLEELVLNRCYLLKRLTILSGMLKRLVVAHCKILSEATIDAPNLHAIKYKGAKMPFVSLKMPNLHEAKFYLESAVKVDSRSCSGKNHIPSLWFTRLVDFLKQLGSSKGLKLVMRHNKDVIVTEELGDIKLFPSCIGLKLEIFNSSKNINDVITSLLRTTHPETITVLSSPKSKLLEFLDDKVTNRVENPGCCTYYTKKCLSHYLKDVKVENEWVCNGIPCEKLSSSPLQTTSFKLEWWEEMI